MPGQMRQLPPTGKEEGLVVLPAKHVNCVLGNFAIFHFRIANIKRSPIEVPTI